MSLEIHHQCSNNSITLASNGSPSMHIINHINLYAKEVSKHLSFDISTSQQDIYITKNLNNSI